MSIKFKIIPDSSINEWVGWFGSDVIKVRIKSSPENMFNSFLSFLNEDLGILPSHYSVVSKTLSNRMIELQLPDVSWELFLSIVE